MILKDDFYQIIERNKDDFFIKLNKNHFIYSAHFPQNPMTPGVIILQIITELFQIILNSKLLLNKIKNLKFIAVINPQVDELVWFKFSKIEQNQNMYGISVEVTNSQQQFVKMTAEFIEP
ncbi:MAG: hypothetical protein FWD66_03600 [Paludibacter sp.]|nr:hypothetical protein [Paludibacter sp.]